MNIRMIGRGCVLAALLLATVLPAQAAAATPLTPRQWREDIATIRTAIAQTHPDPSYSTDPAALDARLDRLQQAVPAPTSRDDAWRRLATLNPLLADAHFCICYDDWRSELRTQRGGDGMFPFAVQVDPGGTIVIRASQAGRPFALTGAHIVAIDGRPAGRIAGELLARMHGDTPGFRAELLSQRFGFYFWKMYGSRRHYDVDIGIASSPQRRLRVAAARRDPAERFEQKFHLEVRADQTAVLTVATFAWPDKAQVLSFMQHSFRRLREEAVQTLIIDVRSNPGGNDDQWIDGLLPYLADTPYRIGSRYRKKIIARYRDDGETLGAVVDGEIDRWIEPQRDNPLFFAGTTYVLVGRGTYSSAILFSNVVQDFGFATLAGSAGLARTQQSGGVQSVALAHSGLVLAVPRFLLRRPSGARQPQWLTPDLLLDDDPLRPAAIINAVREHAAATARQAQRPAAPAVCMVVAHDPAACPVARSRPLSRRLI